MEPANAFGRIPQGLGLTGRNRTQGTVELFATDFQVGHRRSVHPVKLPCVLEQRLVPSLPDGGDDRPYGGLHAFILRCLMTGKFPQAQRKIGILRIEPA